MPRPAVDHGPPIPDWAQPNLLEEAVRDELSSLASGNAAKVAGHLVATGELLDEDPPLALAHARAARQSASRLACVREAVGVAAYHAGEYAEASRELRAYRRLSGRAEYLAVLADCERAAGRPDAALRLLAEAPRTHPGHSEWVEQQIVEAGARRDLGEVEGAILVLRDALRSLRKGAGTGVDPDDLIRLRYAYADGLQAAGRNDEAIAEFAAIAESDDSEMTDAAQRTGRSPDQDADSSDAHADVGRDGAQRGDP
jgi:tetratricopeptide (TPR) repeat protein